MVREERTPDLLALLFAHVGGDAAVVPIVPWPPTRAPSHIPTTNTLKKKRKIGKQTKDSKEREIP